jgi:transposase
MSQTLNTSIAVVGIDIGKNSFHLVGPGPARSHRAAAEVVAWPGRSPARHLPPCLIGMEACVGAHHLSRKLQVLGHDARLMPAKYVRPYSKGNS